MTHKDRKLLRAKRAKGKGCGFVARLSGKTYRCVNHHPYGYHTLRVVR